MTKISEQTSSLEGAAVSVMARGWADLDWSALGLLAARDAGLKSGFLDAANSSTVKP